MASTSDGGAMEKPASADGGALGDDAASSPDATSPANGSGDAATPSTDGGSGAVGGEGGTCMYPPVLPAPNCFSAFAAIGPAMITTVCMATTPPEGQGGSVADGEYVLQSRARYGGSCDSVPVIEATIVVCPGQWAWGEIQEPLTSTTSAATYAWNYAVTHPGASTVLLTPQCSTSNGSTAETFSYTATPGTLTLIQTVQGSTYVSTYEKTSP